LSILIGVNDRKVKKGQTFLLDQWESDYREILIKSRQANEKLRIVLLDPFVLKSGWWMNKGGEWDISRAQINKMGKIVSQLARDFNAIHVKTQEVFDAAAKVSGPEQWIWDGVHPLPQGHELIARNWLEQVSA
ncbi:MAG: GDSL-type esterase/lipase family protein, partial [Verrucomicrobiota bacterium]|nr:GDSL-type esterase/lipase family protein [Verrucomicrobiota bacterium]